jgi:small subunit ribosomal protein S6
MTEGDSFQTGQGKIMASEDGKSLYEGLFLVDSSLASRDADAAIELCKGVLEKHGATVIRAELWAEQRLAYEVRKNKRGAYVLVAFRIDTLKMQEVELECRLTERIMRYLFLNRDGVAIEQWFRRYEPTRAPRRTDEAETAEAEKEPVAAQAD